MNESSNSEIWQVEVGGQIYEAKFSELGEWIGEGSLLADDKVRKGNLRWIEAKRVPTLLPFFNAKAKGEPLPLIQTTTEANDTISDPVPEIYQPPASVAENIPPKNEPVQVANPTGDAFHDPSICFIHPELPSLFICDGCSAAFCKTCPKSYGGTVKICPACGQMCRAIEAVQQQRRLNAARAAAVTEGFGFGDFVNALAHPFKFKTSLFVGALMFSLFTLGQSVSALGGIFMMIAALFCVMLANMLSFGVLANTVDKFVQGDLEANFMPSFEDFNIWDDVLHPFFLSIGAYLVSFGPFIVAFLIGLYLVFSSLSAQHDTFQSEIERLPGTQYYAGRKVAEQSNDVKQVLGDINDDQEARLNAHNEIAAGNTNVVVDRESKEQEELWAAAQETRRVQLESALGKTPETREREFNEMVSGFLSVSAPVAVISFLLLLWGVFLFPAACAVAAYSRSFFTVMNPIVVLDTVKRLGIDHIKIVFMGLLLGFASFMVGVMLGAVFASFDLPGFGNLPAKAIGAFFGFYITVVFSCIIAYALYKNADRLALYR